jgi:S1-C subfamily serine protease
VCYTSFIGGLVKEFLLIVLVAIVVTRFAPDPFKDRKAVSPEPTVVQLFIDDYTCSGAIVKKNLILTAGHCVKDPAKNKVVVFSDQEVADFNIYKFEFRPDCVHDWALITAETGPRPIMTLASEDPGIMAQVFSIGHPYGLSHQFLAVHKWITRVQDNIIMSGFAIGGESGSALYNSHNKVLGVVVCSAGNEESFAVSVDSYRKLIEEWRE